MEFCEQYELIISNTVYEVLHRRISIWKVPGAIRRLQLNYILVKKKFWYQIKSNHIVIGIVIGISNLELVKSLLKLLYGMDYVVDVGHGQWRRKIETVYKQWRCGCRGRWLRPIVKNENQMK